MRDNVTAADVSSECLYLRVERKVSKPPADELVSLLCIFVVSFVFADINESVCGGTLC